MDGCSTLLQAPNRFHPIMCPPFLPTLVRVMREEASPRHTKARRDVHRLRRKPHCGGWSGAIPLLRCSSYPRSDVGRRHPPFPSFSFFLGGQSSHHGGPGPSRCTPMQCALVRCGWVILVSSARCVAPRGEVRWQGRLACETCLAFAVREQHHHGPRLNFVRHAGCDDELGGAGMALPLKPKGR